MGNLKDDLEVLKAGKPYLRGVLAFITYIRFGSSRAVDDCYMTADKFIKQLETDIKSNV